MQKLVAGVVLQNAEKNAVKPFGDKEYHYFVLSDVSPGDLVVLDTASGYRIGKVCRLLPIGESKYASKFIIQKVDLDGYTKQIEKLEELNHLEAALHAELVKESEETYYKGLLASENETIRSLAQSILDKQ